MRCETHRGHPAKMILRFADEGRYDLIVIGHSDHSEAVGPLVGRHRRSDRGSCPMQRADCQKLICLTVVAARPSLRQWGLPSFHPGVIP
ncbi:MAG: universal stress protein [Limisphaerales bacterium]